MNTKVCDHTSVGILVFKDDSLLLIERKNFPFGFAPPAGHVDGDVSFEIAAKRELKEEVGLDAEKLELLWEGRKDNTCRRKDGTWHYWKIYKAQVSGKLNRSLDETKQVSWYNQKQIKVLSEKTESYLAGNVNEEEWEKSPGIETVWYDILSNPSVEYFK